MIFGLLSAISTVLTFVSIFVTVQISIAATWLPYLLWGAVAVCLLLLLLLAFIANYTGHVRIVGELNEAHKKTVDELTASHKLEIETLKQSQHAEIERLNQEHSTRSTPDLYGKIKEVYFQRSGYGLYITLRLFIANRGADTTIQPFVLKFLFKGREYIALEEDDVTDYCVLRTIDKPLWPTMSREEIYEELTDLSADNLKPLDRHRHREGWLRFRIPRLTAYTRGEGGELTLEITDATDRVVPVKVYPPWPQDGVIRFTQELRTEWNEAFERTRRRRQLEQADSQEFDPPNAS